MLFTGKHEVCYNAEYEGAGDLGHGYGLTPAGYEAERHTTDAGYENHRYHKEVAIIVKIDWLEHFKSRNRYKAIERHADAAHHARGNGVEERDEGSDEGDYHGKHGGICNGYDGGIAGYGDTADGFAVCGIGTSAEQRTRKGAHAVAEERIGESRIIEQVFADY